MNVLQSHLVLRPKILNDERIRFKALLVSDDILSFLFKYPISKLSVSEASQIEMLIKTIVYQKPVLRASDIFVVSTKLLASVSGTIVTYVLVALQFHSVEFGGDHCGGLAVVSESWLTPLKKEVFWPPFKSNNLFTNSLKNAETPNDKWKLYPINRIYFQTDDLAKAQHKIKQAEETSNIETDYTEDDDKPRRKRVTRKLYESDSDDNDELPISKLRRPPTFSEHRFNTRFNNSFSTTQSDANVNTRVNFIQTTPLPLATSSVFNENRLDSHFNNSSTLTTHGDTSVTRTVETIPAQKNIITGNEFNTLLTEILKLKHQQNEILSLLRQSSKDTSSTITEYTPPIQLPITNITDLDKIEKYLADPSHLNHFKSYCATFAGGKDLVPKTNKILRSILADEVATLYNYCGQNKKGGGKKSFASLKLNEVVLYAVKNRTEFNDAEIKLGIQNWLKHAPKRLSNKTSSHCT
ncbi:hypothetical protein FQR65_LT19054 [Abscondita terminalis]|nr:hypothetical protein FQR65_LT19054 [Abscondita terminalis]